MKIKGFNINIIILTVLIFILIYFLGSYLYNYYNVENPLYNEIMQIDGIINVELIENNQKTDILISLKPGFNLYDIYGQASNIAQSALEQKLGNIIINSNYSEEIKTVFYKIQYDLYQGIANRKYRIMKDNIDNIVAETDYNCNLWVDKERVYLQLNNKNESLYKIIELKEGKSNG